MAFGLFEPVLQSEYLIYIFVFVMGIFVAGLIAMLAMCYDRKRAARRRVQL